MNRRGFLGGLIAAPAIVAAGNIMPVRSIERFADGYAFRSGNVWQLGDVFQRDGQLYIVTMVGTSESAFQYFALAPDSTEYLIGLNPKSPLNLAVRIPDLRCGQSWVA